MATPASLKSEKKDLNQSLKRLGEIVSWFEDQTDMDVEKGLLNVKEGVVLIKSCKERLAQIENEFIDIQREISDDSKKS